MGYAWFGRGGIAAGSNGPAGSSPSWRTAAGDRRRPTRSSSPPALTRGSCRPAEPDGERILTWTQVYDLSALPERLIVVGSGVTGAEFASGYQALGSTSPWSRAATECCRGEDADAAEVLEDVFKRRGMNVLRKSRGAR